MRGSTDGLGVRALEYDCLTIHVHLEVRERNRVKCDPIPFLYVCGRELRPKTANRADQESSHPIRYSDLIGRYIKSGCELY